MKRRSFKTSMMSVLHDYRDESGNLPITHLRRWSAWPTWRRMFTAWVVLIISLASTFAAWRNSLLRSEAEAHARFEIEAQRIKLAVIDRFEGYEELMSGMKGLFVASHDVEHGEWRDYVRSLDTEIHNPEIQFFGFVDHVTPDHSIEFFRFLETEYARKFSESSRGNDDAYRIRYLEPLTSRNVILLGRDLHQETAFRYAMERARDTGKVNLAYGAPLFGSSPQNPTSRDAVVLFLPVYRNGMDSSNEENRQKALSGFILTQFRVSDMMNHLSERMAPDVTLRLFEGTQMHPSRLLFHSDTPQRGGARRQPAFMTVMQIQVLGRSWLMHFATGPLFEASIDHARPNLILMSGLMGSFLLFGMVWSLVRGADALMLAGNMSEEIRLRDRAIAATSNGVLITDPSQPDNPIVYVNSSFERITGYSASEALGRNPRFLWGQDGEQRMLGELRVAIREKRECRVELRNYRKDGTLFWNELSVSPVRNDEGAVTHFVGIQVDITERKRTEEAMLGVQKLESLGVLAGGIAHDFNNLLAVVLGNAELGLKELRTHPARQFIEQIEIASMRGAELCKQMLAYSGKGRFVIQPIQLNQVMEEMTHLLEVSISKRVNLEYQLAPKLPLVEVDATQIRQVIMNLVVNASDAIGDQDGTITVSTGLMRADAKYLAETPLTDLKPGEYVYLEVKDTGCGMSPDTKARIFDPFFTTKFMGRGLGLAALLGIARGHRGTIRVDTELGTGSSFRFMIPCMPNVQMQPVAAPTSVAAWQGSGTVLVVDDEDDIRIVIARMVESLGFHAVTATDGEQAVRIFREQSDRIELVLLDLTMPHMSGEEAFNEMRRIRPETRIVVMSGYNEEETKGRFDGNSFAGFIQKPFRLSDLRFKLEKAFTHAVS